MEIGTIGAGDFAQAFSKRALKAGHKVKLSNSRGPESLREIVIQLGPGAIAATTAESAACEVVLLAVPWDNVPETLASLPKWKNQILIDGTNPFHGKAGDFIPADVGNLSTSQLVAALAPGARVVKALNNMTVPNLDADPVVNGARRVAFVSADDDGAKKRVKTLLEGLGYSVIDLGNLRDGGLIQQAGGPLAGRDLLERGE
jgi:predicted dinucleotide-binding enzyme